MLERILDLGKRGLLIDEVCTLQTGRDRFERVLGELGNTLNQGQRQLPLIRRSSYEPRIP